MLCTSEVIVIQMVLCRTGQEVEHDVCRRWEGGGTAETNILQTLVLTLSRSMLGFWLVGRFISY